MNFFDPLYGLFSLHFAQKFKKKIMSGSAITISNGQLNVPNDPIIPFIEGDGT